ncbi:MAG: hypothetical protein ACREBN_04665 [Burkholderiaceae bacterium]
MERSLGLASSAAAQPVWIEMKHQAAALPQLWRELAQRARSVPAAA